MSEDRISALEELVTHQEKQIQDLSDVIITQGKEIEGFHQTIAKLEAKIGSLEDNTEGAVDDPGNVKPPHY